VKPVPWCSRCDRFLSPSTVSAAGTCPSCHGPVDPGRARAATGDDQAAEEPLGPLPWHFKALVGAVAIYLGYRAFQGIEWLAAHV
jgi:hypothetical protein